MGEEKNPPREEPLDLPWVGKTAHDDPIGIRGDKRANDRRPRDGCADQAGLKRLRPSPGGFPRNIRPEDQEFLVDGRIDADIGAASELDSLEQETPSFLGEGDLHPAVFELDCLELKGSRRVLNSAGPDGPVHLRVNPHVLALCLHVTHHVLANRFDCARRSLRSRSPPRDSERDRQDTLLLLLRHGLTDPSALAARSDASDGG